MNGVSHMNQSFSILMAVFLLTVGNFAQSSETFDLATFHPPKGWTRQAAADAVQFSIEDKTTGAFCLVSLFRSVPGLPTPKENFDAAWTMIVKEAVPVSAAPEMSPNENKGEWVVTGGFAPFEKDGMKGLALLYTASGHGRMVNALIITNTQAYQPAVSAFLESISFKKPAQEIRLPQAPSNHGAASHPPLAGNFWKQAGIRQGMLGHAGLSTGTFSKTYHFFSNGTYTFKREDMQLAAPKYYVESEEGTYTVAGNSITITPRKASFSQHRLNKEEPPIKSGNLPLSTARYTFDFWINDGNWALLLSPADGKETKRDGTFSFWRNGEAQRTYQYVLVDERGNLVR
jgi:hypothetical protein